MDEEAEEPAITAVLFQLIQILGAPLVAVIGGARHTRTVRAWQDREAEPNEVALRVAWRAVQILSKREKSDVVRAWFEGCNHLLGGDSLALLIETGDEATRIAVLKAARDFLISQ